MNLTPMTSRKRLYDQQFYPPPILTLPPPPVTDPVVEMDTDADMPDAPNEVAHRLTLLPHLHSKR